MRSVYERGVTFSPTVGCLRPIPKARKRGSGRHELAALGVIAAKPSTQPCGYLDIGCEHSLKDARWTGGIVGALVGTGLGALIGYAIRVERWVPVPLDRLRMELGALPTGEANLRFRLAF